MTLFEAESQAKADWDSSLPPISVSSGFQVFVDVAVDHFVALIER